MPVSSNLNAKSMQEVLSMEKDANNVITDALNVSMNIIVLNVTLTTSLKDVIVSQNLNARI